MSQGWRMGQLMHYLGIRWLTYFLFSRRPTASPIPQPLVELLSNRSLVCFTCGLFSRTVTSYTSAQRRYVAFCDTLNLPPIPLFERVLCLFVANLSHQGLAHQSIITYWSGVRNFAIAIGTVPEKRDQMPRLQLVLRGVARNSSHRNGWSIRLHITGSIMHCLAGVRSIQEFESYLMWAVTSVGYFGFMRVGEFTAVDSAPPNILMSEVAINSRSAPSAIRIRLR